MTNSVLKSTRRTSVLDCNGYFAYFDSGTLNDSEYDCDDNSFLWLINTNTAMTNLISEHLFKNLILYASITQTLRK